MPRPKIVSENAKAFGQNLAKLRKAHLYYPTVRKLADATFLAPETIRAYENGSREPTLSQICLLMWALQCSFMALAEGCAPKIKPARRSKTK